MNGVAAPSESRTLLPRTIAVLSLALLLPLALVWVAVAGNHLPPPVVTIVKVLDLDMGFCEATPSVTYVTDAAPSPGAQSCPGAQAGQFLITTVPTGASVTISKTPKFVDVIGPATEKITQTTTPSGNNITVPAGGLTVYVGGTYKIPVGGAISGLYTGTHDVTAQ